MSAELTKEERRLLRSLVPLHLLSDQRFEELTGGVAVEQAGRGEILFREGEEDHYGLYLLEGKLALLTGDRVAEQVTAGSNTARFPIAHNTPRKMTARVVNAARFVRVDSQRLSAVLAQDHTTDYQVNDLDEDVDDADWMTQLLHSKVLQQIPPENIQRVMLRVEQLDVKAGESIIRQGEPGDYYYMLSRGQAVVSRDQGDGNPPVELARLGAGSSFGEEALLSDSPRNSTITMLTDGIVLRLSKTDFVELVHHPLSKTLDFATASAMVAEGAVWLDVRPPEEFSQGHLSGSLNLPFDVLRYQTGTLANDRHYVIVSGRGGSATAAAFLLTENGLEASVLKGGYDAVVPRSTTTAPAGAPRKVMPGSANAARERELEQRVLALQGEHKTLERQLKEAIDTARERLQAAEQARQVVIAERDDARAENTKLTGRLEVGELDREGMRQRLAESEEREAALKERLRKSESHAIAERDRAESASQRYEDLARQLDGLRTDRDTERKASDQALGQLKEEYTELQLALEQVRGELEEAHSRTVADAAALAASEQKLVAVNTAQKDLEQRYAQAEARARELGEQLDELRRSTGDGDSVREQLATQLHAAESRSEAVEKQLATQGEEIERLRVDAAAASDARAALQAELDARRGEQERLQQEVAAQRQAAAALTEQLQQAEGVAARVAELEGLLGERGERLAALEAERNAAQKELAELGAAREDERQDFANRLAELENRLKGASESRTRAETERDNLQQDLKARTESLKGLQAALEEQRGKLQDLDNELEEARAAHAARQDETATRLLDLGQRLERVESQRADALAQAETYRKQLDQERDRLAQAESRVQAQAADLQAAEAAAAEARAAHAADLAELEARASAAQARLEAERDALVGDLDQAHAAAQLALQQQQALEAAQREQAAGLDDLQQQLAAADERAQQQEQALQAAATAGEQLRGERDALQQQLAAKAAEVAAERECGAAVAQDLAAANERTTLLDGELQAVRQDRDAARREVQRLREAANRQLSASVDADGALQAAEERVAAAEAEAEALQRRLDAVQTTAAELTEAQAAIAGLRARVDELSAERDRLVAARDAEAAALQAAEQAAATLAGEHDEELGALRAELEEAQARLARREAAAEDAETLLAQQQQSEEALREQVAALAAERDGLHAALAAANAAGVPVSGDTAQTLETLWRERDAARADAARLHGEVEELRDVMEQYAEQIRAAHLAAEEIEGLNTELNTVRQQASDDVSRLRDERDAARAELKQARVEVDSAPLQLEALRQEVSGLRGALAERQRELVNAERVRHRLEDQLEDAARDLEELRRTAVTELSPDALVQVPPAAPEDSAESTPRDSVPSRPIEEVGEDGLRDARIRPPRRAIDVDKVTGRSRAGSLLLGLAGGLLLVLGALELATLLTGRGELFRYLFGSG